MTRTVYLAGKIGANDWRHDVVSGLRDAIHDHSTPWPVLEGAVFGRLHYVGPYFVSCDHACNHGRDSHGYGLATGGGCSGFGSAFGHGPATGTVKDLVVGQCLDAIGKADLVFAWIDSPNAHGTFFELGYALSRQKDVVVAYPSDFPTDHGPWFIFAAVQAMNGSHALRPATSASEALTTLLLERGLLFKSPLEQEFWAEWMKARRGLELVAQHRIGRYQLDFAHLPTKTAIELDGFTYHRDQDRFTADRKRDRLLAEQGWLTVRFSSNELHESAATCVKQAVGLIMKRRLATT